jgi:hypothetical protein
MFDEANIFYELFLQDSFGQLIDVPILIRNYQDQSGNKPNAEGTLPVSTWKLVRRFFILDSISGVYEGQSMSLPQFIRFASKISLKVKMDTDSKEAIYRPFLIVEYKDIEVAK